MIQDPDYMIIKCKIIRLINRIRYGESTFLVESITVF